MKNILMQYFKNAKISAKNKISNKQFYRGMINIQKVIHTYAYNIMNSEINIYL